MPSSASRSSIGDKRFPSAQSRPSAHPDRATPLERTVDAIAETQHGVVTVAQLREAGLSRQMIWRRVRKGRFAPLHRGIYRVGPRLSARADEMAAVLACGPSAVLSHRSAAALWGLLPPPRRGAGRPALPHEISVWRSDRGRAAAGVRAHRVTTLGPGDRTTREGIPVTTPARTLLDLATLAARRPETAERDPLPPVTRRDLERAVAKAEREGLASSDDLRAHLAASPRWPGSVVLRHILDLEGGPAFTRSEAEERLLDLIRKARLPPPRTNVRVDRFEVDFLWSRAGVAIEVDGYAFHASRDRFEGDRARDGDLAALGVLVIRVTWRQICDEPLAVVSRVAQALGRAEARSAATPCIGG
jgi:very-short-patch-repair endonuclease